MQVQYKEKHGADDSRDIMSRNISNTPKDGLIKLAQRMEIIMVLDQG